MEIREEDLEISGTHITEGGETKWAEIIKHKPTGIVVVCSEHRSQLKNKAGALAMLREKLDEISKKPEPDRFVMYVIVRTSLKMNLGKTAASVGHAVQMLMQDYAALYWVTPEEKQQYDDMTHWLKDDFPSYAKIVLGASDEEFEAVKKENKNGFLVVDRGFSQVAAGSETVFGCWPCRKSGASPTVKKLKPLR